MYAGPSTGFTWGLPAINSIIYAIDIQQEYNSGAITNNMRWAEHGAGAAGIGLASLAAATEAPAVVPATGAILLAFDLTLAQEMTNNLIKGQSFWDAFFEARESTINVYFFGTDAESVDASLNNFFQ